ncbi:hypothetical protein [Dactylosporangium sp. CS-033363]|uniref:hypothetical protein n=1 Tax=Dactylosporangium sp. CS-033363 TaxID=3239935 RepID=UPI003D93373F
MAADIARGIGIAEEGGVAASTSQVKPAVVASSTLVPRWGFAVPAFSVEGAAFEESGSAFEGAAFKESGSAPVPAEQPVVGGAVPLLEFSSPAVGGTASSPGIGFVPMAPTVVFVPVPVSPDAESDSRVVPPGPGSAWAGFLTAPPDGDREG